MTASLGAQTADFIILQWQQQHVQTDIATVNPASGNSYLFRTDVDGTGMTSSNPFTAVTLTMPDGSTMQTLVFDTDFDGWKYESTGYADQTALIAAFPITGNNYMMNFTDGGSNPTVNFGTTPDITTNILQAPVVTLTGGTWMGGSFYVTDVSQDVTITFNTPYASAPGGTDSFHYDVSLRNGPLNGSFDIDDFVNYDALLSAPTSPTIAMATITGGTMIDGNTYELEVNYDQLMGSLSGLLGGSDFELFLASAVTHINIITPAAVPEPATWGLMMGVVALTGVMITRRRRKRE